VIDRAGLAEFLRRRREEIRPLDVGLREGPRRRTPGLRRDEVAHLAGMSTDYYTRLEQGRGPHPSASLLAAVARALRLDADEHDHLFHLAGLVPSPRRAGRHIRPGLLSLAQHLGDIPVFIVSDVDEVLWQNDLGDSVMGPPDPRPGRPRSFTWRWFTDPDSRLRFPAEDWEHHSDNHVRDLRATHGRRAGDSDVVELVADLRAASPEFDRLWARHDVAVRSFDHKRILHPEVGVLHLTCEVMLTPAADVRLLAFFPTAGTDAADKLALLRVIGAQDLSTMS
jgi:transcriptional regulator with XRE-family HTH domain